MPARAWSRIGATPAPPLTAAAQRLLIRRAESLRRQLVVRYPFVDTLLGLVARPGVGSGGC